METYRVRYSYKQTFMVNLISSNKLQLLLWRILNVMHVVYSLALYNFILLILDTYAEEFVIIIFTI